MGTQKSKLLSREGLFFLMALSLGGVVGTWAMNFIDIFGLVLFIPQIHLFVPIFYEVWPTIISLGVALVMSFAGLYVASGDPMFAKTKAEIVASLWRIPRSCR